MAVVARSGMLQAWLQPTASTKRKRDAMTFDEGNEELMAIETAVKAPAKRNKVSTKATAAKPTISGGKATAKAGVNTSKEAKKLYAETVKVVEKRYLELDKKVKAMSPNSRAITVTNYATSSAKHLNTAKKLSEMGETVLAFKFVMALADASHRSITTFKMSGEGGSCEAAFAKLDQALLPLINKRKQPTVCLDDAGIPSVPHRWTQSDAEVGIFKTGRPNKQQRNAMDRQFIDWEKGRRAERRNRREECEDWAKVALADLTEDRDYLAKFGVGEDFSQPLGQERNCYFEESIGRLKEMVAGR